MFVNYLILIITIVFMLPLVIYSEKKILFWTKMFDSESWNMEGWYPQYKNMCSTQHQCSFTPYSQLTYKDVVQTFDAILFHNSDLSWLRKSPFSSLPSKREPSQVYVFYSLESPSMDMTNLQSYDGFFNMTMSYRLDSDIYVPYNGLKLINEPLENNLPPKTWLTPKFNNSEHNAKERNKRTTLVGWIVSNCVTPAKREHFVRKLNQYMTVNQAGGCNNRPCSYSCYDQMFSTTKFYLALENSDCQDYVTEKFWTALERGAVPIVSGKAGYEKVVPPHSYINIQDFDTVESLAEYLLVLDKNATLYNQYKWWTQFYTLTETKANRRFHAARAMCDLCTKLHHPAMKGKVYTMSDWWEYGKCTVPYNTDWFTLHNQIEQRIISYNVIILISVVMNILLVCFIVRCRPVARLFKKKRLRESVLRL